MKECCKKYLNFEEIPVLKETVYPNQLPSKGNVFLYVRPHGALYYYDSLGNEVQCSIASPKGTSGQRPILDSEDVGIQYYDTTLKKVIVWDGTKWINVNGSTL